MERIEKPANIQNNGTQRKKKWSLFWVILLSNTQMTMKIHGIHHQTKDYVWNFHEAKTKFTIYYMKLPVQENLNHFVFHVRTDDLNSERSLKLIAKSIVDLVPTFKNNTMPVFRKKHLLFVSNELSEISKERNSTIRRRSNNNI